MKNCKNCGARLKTTICEYCLTIKETVIDRNIAYIDVKDMNNEKVRQLIKDYALFLQTKTIGYNSLFQTPTLGLKMII
jgi:hypothetical protein